MSALKALASEIGGTYVVAAKAAPAKEGTIEWIMAYIERHTGLGKDDLTFSKQMGGYKIETVKGRDLSPRTGLKEIGVWASAFVKGFDAARGRL